MENNLEAVIISGVLSIAGKFSELSSCQSLWHGELPFHSPVSGEPCPGCGGHTGVCEGLHSCLQPPEPRSPALSHSWPSLSTRQRSPRWATSTVSASRSWTGGELSLVRSAKDHKIAIHSIPGYSDFFRTSTGNVLQCIIVGLPFFQPMSLFSRPCEES